MGRSTITLTCYHTHYCTISLSLAWFGGYLQRVTTRYRQFFWKNINIHFCCWCLWQQGISRICVVFLWIIVRQAFLGRYIISLFDYNRPTWIQAVIAVFVEKVFLKKNLNFNMQGETSIFILPHKTSFWHFCQKGTLPSSVNMEVLPNIWNRNSFLPTSLYALRVHRLFQRRKLYNWIYFTVKVKLNSS